MTDITNSRILILSTHGFEQSELEHPRDALKSKGATVHIATPDGEDITGWDGDNWGDKATADMKLADVDVADYDALVLPGGQINPDILRTNEDAVALIKSFATKGKPIAAICHAPWLLIEAGIIERRKATSYGSIQTDMKNAGAHWEDSAVVVDNGIITSRSPEDLDAFVAKIVEEVEEGAHHREAA
ncbi:type 1 glutamine amidotransferase domain-containing protein [Sulfitobacter aestuariivivens]|uniref:Type 1 glutamine amidotransferase n=1 Tax=Sulfitobacter aestuariivivens TaxID=2766981 RepID=A0A927D8D3_9RHOB|nr:type 1 glutamine amidotransferase domain-containing protein [Sulfitobacter aestuariivivens]MBD3665097.1 type 1 glutamine amidotransferase [Sulfitobacter aestuariivivens]